jgi:predicted DNA-binding protein (MmcQ/YjbR family)
MTPDDLRGLVSELPAVTEDVKWGEHLTFLIANKIFAIAGFSPVTQVSFKVHEEDFAELTGREGITQAPHSAKGQWVQVGRPSALSRREWVEYLSRSYHLVVEKLPKKTRKELGI